MGLGFGMDFFAGLAEGKPSIPKFTPVNVQDEQQKAVSGNLAILPDAQKIASSVNTFNQAELEKMLASMIPGYTAIKNRISSNIQDQLEGKIPDDISAMVRRNSAVRSIYGGFGGTGMARNLTLRDLGLTSLDMTQRGLDAATRWLSSGATAPLADVSGMFISPVFQAQFAKEERDSKFQHDYVSNLNDWQHSIGYLWGQDMRSTGETIKQLAASYLGSMGGGIGGGFGGGGGNTVSGNGSGTSINGSPYRTTQQWNNINNAF